MAKFDKEVEDALGADIYAQCLEQVDAGCISKTQAIDIATKMYTVVGGNLKRALEDNSNYKFDRTAARIVFSDWYENDPKEVNVTNLLKILRAKNVSLLPLALELEKISRGQTTESVANQPPELVSAPNEIEMDAIKGTSNICYVSQQNNPEAPNSLIHQSDSGKNTPVSTTSTSSTSCLNHTANEELEMRMKADGDPPGERESLLETDNSNSDVESGGTENPDKPNQPTSLLRKAYQLATKKWKYVFLVLILTIALVSVSLALIIKHNTDGMIISKFIASEKMAYRMGGNKTTPSTQVQQVPSLSTCPNPLQNPPPPLPIALSGHTVVPLPHGLLVIGGTDGHIHDSRTVFIWRYNTSSWQEFAHKLNRVRRFHCVRINGRKIIVSGGTSTTLPKKCGNNNREWSEEVFDLDNPDKGWQLKVNDISRDSPPCEEYYCGQDAVIAWISCASPR